MAVVFDNSAHIIGINTQTLTTPFFAISSATNRAAMVFIGWTNTSATSITTSCGGVNGSLITDTGAVGNTRSITHSVLAPASGSQTATASWTTALNGFLGVVTATGVDQTTPVNNGTNLIASSVNSLSRSVTSVSGDLTAMQVISFDSTLNETITTTAQTERWNELNGTNIRNHAGSTGAGAGTNTHSWSFANTVGSTGCCCSGANFKWDGIVGGVASIDRSNFRGIQRGVYGA